MNRKDRERALVEFERRRKTPRAYYVLEKLARFEVQRIKDLGEEHPAVRRLESTRQALEDFINTGTEISVEHALMVLDMIE